MSHQPQHQQLHDGGYSGGVYQQQQQQQQQQRFFSDLSSSGSHLQTAADAVLLPDADAFPVPWPVMIATAPDAAFHDEVTPQQEHDPHAVPSPGQTSSSYSYSSYASTHRSSEDDDEMADAMLLQIYDEPRDANDGRGDNNDTSSSSKTKQSAQQRRVRNRESMRRSRMKEKEVLTALRTTLAQLEARFTTLTQFEESQSASNDPRRCRLLQNKLAHVVQLKRELEAEKSLVMRFLDDKRASVAELQRVLAECQLLDDDNDAKRTAEKLELLEEQARRHARSLAPGRIGALGQSSMSPLSSPTSQPFEFGYSALSTTQLNELLATFCADLQRVKALAQTAAAASPPSLEVFGWQTHRHIDAQSQMHFEFTKAFPHWSTREVVDRAWRDAVDLGQYKEAHNKRHSRIRRMEFLQRVDEHLGVIVREIKHPEDNTIFRTHYALFMLETPEGFLFGIQSINPSAEQQLELERELEQQRQQVDPFDDDAAPPSEKVVWVDASISIEFQRHPRQELELELELELESDSQDDDAARRDFCEVRWRGKTNYKSPKHAAESAMGFLMGILKWENDVVGPRFHLTSS